MLSDDELRAALTTRIPDLDPDVEAELARVLDRAGSRAHKRHATYVLGLVAAIVATVLVLGHDWKPESKGPDPVDHAPVRAHALAAKRGMYVEPAALKAGRYEAWFLGDVEPSVRIQLDVPGGWGQDDLYALATGPGDHRATRRVDLFINVRRILTDPCRGVSVQPGPGPLDLARELASLKTARAVGPTPVTLDGYPGYFIRLEAGRAHASPDPCAGGGVLREDGNGGTMIGAYDMRGWTDLVWVLEVAGNRVVISASHGPDVSPAQEAELVAMVESASFVLP
jgi:hypothetical protein